MDQTGFLLAIHRAARLTPSRYDAFLSFFDSWEKAYEASPVEWMEAGIEPKVIDRFFASKKNSSPERELELIAKSNAKVLTRKNFGPLGFLDNIHNPPTVILMRGEVKGSFFPSISVVGSRKITSYGKNVIKNLIEPLAAEGVNVVSGLALGVDICAHKAAIDNGAQTLAVLGSGIDNLAPATNARFAHDIIKNKKGAVISEFLPETDVRPEFFAIRNRLVSALSKVTIIVEAAHKSGSLITARFAMEQGKEVFAIPGEIFAPQSQGCNELILKGEAEPLLEINQIRQILNLDKKNLKTEIELTTEEQDLVSLFGGEKSLEIDELIRSLALPSSQIQTLLVMLELKGVLQKTDANSYRCTIF